jgi:CheY-like chemotaxis protein
MLDKQTALVTFFRGNKMKTTILIIENEDAVAGSIQLALQQEGYDVTILVKPRFNVLKRDVVGYLKDTPKKEPIDFLVLDMHDDGDDFGGLLIYAEIIKEGLRRRFKHLLICSRYMDAEGKKTAGYGAICGLSIACDVPENNLLPKLVMRNPRLFTRIKQLLEYGPDPSVHVREPWKKRRKSETS